MNELRIFTNYQKMIIQLKKTMVLILQHLLMKLKKNLHLEGILLKKQMIIKFDKQRFVFIWEREKIL
jgi:hypothetical protein